MFRINFGNGQVSESFATLKAAKKAHFAMKSDQYFEFSRIQFREDGEWFFKKVQS